MMDSIVILDDEETEEPSSSTLCLPKTSFVSGPSVVPEPTHITESPFGSAKKSGHVLKVENEKLFQEVCLLGRMSF